jgi:predicted RNase H-like nuclease
LQQARAHRSSSGQPAERCFSPNHTRRLRRVEKLLAIGCDGARGGWVSVTCFGESATESGSWHTQISLRASIAEVVALHGDSDAMVGVDIPMGLLDSVDFRPCDREARSLLQNRRGSVWQAPSRPLLAAATYAEARAQVDELRKTQPEAKSLSSQAFALAPKIKEVDDFLQGHPAAQAWLYEVHPELCFRQMNGHPLDDPKRSWPGQHTRMRLVERAFPDAREGIATSSLAAKDAQLEDILDAYAALYSALRVGGGANEQIGGERDSLGIVMRMVF